MISAILFLAGAVGLGLRLVRWVDCLPDQPVQTTGAGTEPPRRDAGWIA
jgi:hypothetical protein